LRLQAAVQRPAAHAKPGPHTSAESGDVAQIAPCGSLPNSLQKRGALDTTLGLGAQFTLPPQSLSVMQIRAQNG
jgi:hypothetical protein